MPAVLSAPHSSLRSLVRYPLSPHPHFGTMALSRLPSNMHSRAGCQPLIRATGSTRRGIASFRRTSRTSTMFSRCFCASCVAGLGRSQVRRMVMGTGTGTGLARQGRAELLLPACPFRSSRRPSLSRRSRFSGSGSIRREARACRRPTLSGALAKSSARSRTPSCSAAWTRSLPTTSGQVVEAVVVEEAAAARVARSHTAENRSSLQRVRRIEDWEASRTPRGRGSEQCACISPADKSKLHLARTIIKVRSLLDCIIVSPLPACSVDMFQLLPACSRAKGEKAAQSQVDGIRAD